MSDIMICFHWSHLRDITQGGRLFQRDQVDKLDRNLEKMINVGKMEITGDLWENLFGSQEQGWDEWTKREGNVGWGVWGGGGGVRWFTGTLEQNKKVVLVYVGELEIVLASKKVRRGQWKGRDKNN